MSEEARAHAVILDASPAGTALEAALQAIAPARAITASWRASGRSHLVVVGDEAGRFTGHAVDAGELLAVTIPTMLAAIGPGLVRIAVADPAPIEARIAALRGGEGSMVELPESSRNRAALRAVIEAMVGIAVPFGSAFTRIYQFTHPPQAQALAETWRQEITAAVNDVDTRVTVLEARLDRFGRELAPALRISAGAIATALALARRSQDGKPFPFSIEDLASDEAARPLLEEQLAELQHHGFVRNTPVIGPAFVRVWTEAALYWSFDGAAMGYDTLRDAATLAGHLLREPALGLSQALHAETGWPLRRFNPAQAFLLPLVSPGLVSRSMPTDYATESVSLDADSRYRLRTLIESVPPAPASRNAAAGACFDPGKRQAAPPFRGARRHL